MAKHLIRHPYNREKHTRDHEVITLPSETIPDQSMSVSEIMSRYARGLSPSGVRVPIYEGDENMKFEDALPDLKHMDLADRQTLMEDAAEQVLQTRTKYNKEQALASKAQAKKKLLDEIEKDKPTVPKTSDTSKPNSKPD